MIPNQPDLYAALRNSGAAPEELPALIHASGPEVAARLAAVDKALLAAILRAGQGEPAVPRAAEIVEYLQSTSPAPLFSPDLRKASTLALPTNGAHPDMPAFSDRAFDSWFLGQGVSYGLGLYGEDRTVYASAQFADDASDERRTVHLGVDVFAPAGTPVFAPLPGRVHVLTCNDAPLDYGHTLILEHRAGEVAFFTLYGHLGESLHRLLAPGMRVEPGQHIADLGDWDENGGWAPHLHFQIITDMLHQNGGNFFGVGHRSLRDIWSCISPDPNLILRLPEDAFRL